MKYDVDAGTRRAQRGIANIHVVEFNALGNLRSETVGQIVDTHYAMPLAQQSIREITAYKAGTARYENAHGTLTLLLDVHSVRR